MAPQTVAAFLVLSVVMLLINERRKTQSRLGDALSLVLCAQVLVMAAGYIFGGRHLFGLTNNLRTSPQTLLCLMLLAGVAFGRRAQWGVFRILYGFGIGSKVSRFATPIALLLPFLLEAGRTAMGRMFPQQKDYVTAVMTSLTSLFAVGLVLALAWRIDELEREVRELSLRDELTKLYNRRGFFVLAEQAYRQAVRARRPFSVLFVDLDDLKMINDTYGHDSGSSVICELAEVLRAQVRNSDIIGRMGGDEFAVASHADAKEIKMVAQRLERAGEACNAIPGRESPFGFSIGYVTSDPEQPETLQDLLHRADTAMYQSKRRRKSRF